MCELLEFFTIGYQMKLMKKAQLANQPYENALNEYRKLFIGELIKSYNKSELVDPKIRKYIFGVLSDDQSKSIAPGLEVDFIIESDGKTEILPVKHYINRLFGLIIKCYICWISCDSSGAFGYLEHYFNEGLGITIPTNNQYRKIRDRCPACGLFRHNSKKLSELNEKYAYIIDNEKKIILYRGRKSETILDKSDLFHIPFKQVYKVRNQRYSVTGQPLLYLTDSVEGLFNELGINDIEDSNKLYISLYLYNCQNNVNLFDLRANVDSLLNAENEDEFTMMFCKFVLSCICSFPNFRGRNQSFFVEEYVIPQLVTQLVKKCAYDGICYNSIYNSKQGVSSNKSVEYNNYVLFTSKYRADSSVDENLRNKFEVTTPVNISEICKSFGVVDVENAIKIFKQQFALVMERDSLRQSLIGDDLFICYEKDNGIINKYINKTD